MKDSICAIAISPKNTERKASGARKIALVVETSYRDTSRKAATAEPKKMIVINSLSNVLKNAFICFIVRWFFCKVGVA